MFKPDAILGRQREENISVPGMLQRLREHGFELVYLGARTEFAQEQAREFYAVHQGKWFYEPLVQYITSGPVVPALIRYNREGPAVQALRSILPSLRQEFGIEKGNPELKKVERNKIHASDSPQNAIYEGTIAFRSELRTLDVEALVATIAEPVSAFDLFKKIGKNSALRQIRALKEQIIKASSEFNQSKRQLEEVGEIGDLGLKIAKLLSQENYSLEKTQGILQKAVSELSETLGLIFRLLTYAATANTKSIQPLVSAEAQKMVKKIEAAMEPAAREKKAAETAFPRSELRNVAALIAAGTEVKTPEEFFERNFEQGGGHEQGFRSVTEKIMDGIYSLLTHTFNAAEIVSSALFPEVYTQEMLTVASKPEMFLTKTRFAAAKTALGVKTFNAGDVLVIGRGFALEQGAIAAVRTVFGDIPVLIYTDQAEDVGFLEQLNVQLAQAHRPPVLVARNPDEARKLLDEEAARLRQAGVSSIHFKAMVYEAETLPEALVKQLSDVTVVTSRMFKHFLNLAGSRIAALAQEVQVKFAFARSA
jgi:nucleoside-diphosphate kinase